MKYKAVADECVVTEDDGTLIWRGQPEPHKVVWAEAVPGGEEGWILYDHYHPEKNYGGFENLAKIRSSGLIVLRAQLPATSDAYIHAELTNGKLLANSFGGFRVELNPSTGRIVSSVFTK